MAAPPGDVDEVTFSIGEVTERTGVSATTLRFYEDEGLFAAPIRRDAAGRRRFREVDVEWVQVCSRLRASDMPLELIHRYVELFRSGPDTVEDRMRLLERHREDVRARIRELQDASDVIDQKVTLYAQALADGTADQLWSHGPLCD
ncbi:MerR family transcriptional regulator [uncultured Jatrophihabitans sp.]|uniref:MerR family transcriptional regulator n=1 Tax=uncultured Jatrophihabitans sp. TaxID=1610747 RepID=UPI0035C97A15